MTLISPFQSIHNVSYTRQARKAAKRARTEPKLSIGPGDHDVVSLGLALLALLDPNQSYSEAYAVLDRLEAAADGLDVNAALAIAQCASCRVKVDLCCYKVGSLGCVKPVV